MTQADFLGQPLPHEIAKPIGEHLLALSSSRRNSASALASTLPGRRLAARRSSSSSTQS